MKDLQREFGAKWEGAIFLSINRWGAISKKVTPLAAINVIIKRAIIDAGLDPSIYLENLLVDIRPL